MFAKEFVSLILAIMCITSAGCESHPNIPIKSANYQQIRSDEPSINLVSGRKTSDEDVIDTIGLLNEDNLLATQLTYGNLLRFDKDSKKWIILDTYRSNGWALNSIFFFDELHGFIVGNHGTIIKTNDGGKNWEQLPRFSDLDLKHVMFFDSANGYIIAGEAIVDKKTGALNYKSITYSTRNGGETWEEFFKIDGEEVFDIAVFSVKTAVISIAGRYLVRTDDSGKSWNRVNVDLKDANSITVNSEGNGWLVSWKGEFRKSTDQGLSWNTPENIPSEYSTQEWEDISFDEFGNGFAVSANGIIAYTTNNGNDWKTITQISESRFRSVTVRDGVRIILSAHEIYSISFKGL